MTIQELDQLGDKILNEWGINNAKSLGLQACTEAIRLAVELDKYKQADKHGKWIDVKPNGNYTAYYPQCSICEAWALQSGGHPCKTEYCPTCGAHMEMEADDGTEAH